MKKYCCSICGKDVKFRHYYLYIGHIREMCRIEREANKHLPKASRNIPHIMLYKRILRKQKKKSFK